jgi:hypothetical protein
MQVMVSKSMKAPLALLLSRVSEILARVRANGEHGSPAGKAGHRHYDKPNHLDCGGYNEAFVMQYWTGYNPRH